MEKKKITTEVVNDVKKVEEIKDEIVNYAKEKIDIEVQNSFRKIEKKIVKSKNGKIFRRDIIIIILLCLSGFLSYKLYKTGYFNDYFYLDNSKKDIKPVEENPNEEKPSESKPSEPEKDLSFHKVALDKIFISSNSAYLNEYYSGDLKDELLLYLALNNIDTDCFIQDEDSYILNSDDLKKSFDSLFLDKEYVGKSFNYNDNKFKYLSSQSIYVFDKFIDVKNNNSIKRYVTKIEENDNKVIIKTIEAQINNNKMINILTKKVIGTYKDENSLNESADKLTQIEYVFDYNDGSYKLLDINTIK